MCCAVPVMTMLCLGATADGRRNVLGGVRDAPPPAPPAGPPPPPPGAAEYYAQWWVVLLACLFLAALVATAFGTMHRRVRVLRSTVLCCSLGLPAVVVVGLGASPAVRRRTVGAAAAPAPAGVAAFTPGSRWECGVLSCPAGDDLAAFLHRRGAFTSSRAAAAVFGFAAAAALALQCQIAVRQLHRFSRYDGTEHLYNAPFVLRGRVRSAYVFLSFAAAACNVVAWAVLAGLHHEPLCGRHPGGWALSDGGVTLGPAVGLLAFDTAAAPAAALAVWDVLFDPY